MRDCIGMFLAAFVLASMAPVNELQAQDGIHGKRIMGGEPTDIKEHPWQVALNIRIGGSTYLCSGSFIEPQWVLTAAHCFYQENGLGPARAGDVKLKAGVTDYLAQGNWLVAEKLVVNKDYNHATNKDDVALIKLASLPAGANTIPLLDPSVTLNPGQELEVTGWGVTESGAPSHELRKATVPYVDNASCNEPNSYNGRALPGMICAGYREGGVDSCQGDSGGPLVWNSAAGPVLVGVVSWGEGCARKLKYGLYTRVTAYEDWINAVILRGTQ